MMASLPGFRVGHHRPGRLERRHPGGQFDLREQGHGSSRAAFPVNRETIEERIGVRTRMVAPVDERIGVIAFQDLLDTSGIDPARIRVLIAATNVGEDKFDPGPTSRYLYDRIRQACPRALVFDLYAGCPGFNVSMEALYMLTLAGMLESGDLAVIVGAENIHRAEAFKPLDTANIIFGDDALATAVEIGGYAGSSSPGRVSAEVAVDAGEDFIAAIASGLLPWAREGRLDGIIVDNQLGKIEHRIPATAARVQHALMERLFPKEAAAGAFKNFRTAFEIYEGYGAGFGYDLMSSDGDPHTVQRVAQRVHGLGQIPPAGGGVPQKRAAGPPQPHRRLDRRAGFSRQGGHRHADPQPRLLCGLHRSQV